MKIKNIHYEILCLIITFIMLICAYAFPSVVREYAANALDMCGRVLIPTLLPFIILSRIFSVYVMKLARNYNTEGSILFDFIILLLGILTGFPGGALMASVFYENKAICKERTERIIACSSGLSPVFCIYVFGERILYSRLYGAMIFFSAAAVNIVCYLVLSVFQRKNDTDKKLHNSHKDAHKAESDNITNIITNGMMSVINISAFVTFFSCFEGILITLLRFFGLGDNTASITLCSLIEASCGVELISRLSFGSRFIVGSAVIGFGGISAIMQVYSICSKNKISVRKLIIIRVISLFATPLLSIGMLSIIEETKSIFAAVKHKIFDIKALFFTILAVSAVIIALFVIKMRKEYKKSKIIL